MSATTDREPARELASRESDGLAVVLLWYPRQDAFYHPFVYAA